MDTRVIAAVVVIVGLFSGGVFLVGQSPVDNVEENRTASQTGANETVENDGSNQATQENTDTRTTASRASRLAQTVNTSMSDRSYSVSLDFPGRTDVVQRHTDVYDADASVVRRTGKSTFGVSVNKTYLLNQSTVHDLTEQTVSKIGANSQVRVHPARLRAVPDTTIKQRDNEIQLTTQNQTALVLNSIPNYIERSQIRQQTVVVSASDHRIQRVSVTVGTDETTLTVDYVFAYDDTEYQLRTVR